MTPVQYQKQLRLQEARRLLLSEHADVARIGYAIGYESPSQFNREYRRLFGSPPGRMGRRSAGASPRRSGAEGAATWAESGLTARRHGTCGRLEKAAIRSRCSNHLAPRPVTGVKWTVSSGAS